MDWEVVTEHQKTSSRLNVIGEKRRGADSAPVHLNVDLWMVPWRERCTVLNMQDQYESVGALSSKWAINFRHETQLTGIKWLKKMESYPFSQWFQANVAITSGRKRFCMVLGRCNRTIGPRRTIIIWCNQCSQKLQLQYTWIRLAVSSQLPFSFRSWADPFSVSLLLTMCFIRNNPRLVSQFAKSMRA